MTVQMKTPLKRVRGLGSAKDGTEHFWQQRLTAFTNMVLIAISMVFVLQLVGADYETARGLIASPLVALCLLLLVISGLWHMRLGMQVIIEDYIHGEGAKIAAVALNTLFTFAVGAVCIYSILKISFGA